MIKDIKNEYVVESKIIWMINVVVRNNEMESYIWNQIDGNTSIDEIVNQIFCDMEIQGASLMR